jgi:hypothetical protein
VVGGRVPPDRMSPATVKCLIQGGYDSAVGGGTSNNPAGWRDGHDDSIAFDSAT